MKIGKFLYKFNVVICFFLLIEKGVYANNDVYLNEIYPNPQDKDSEWVEIYNPDQQDLKGWQVYDENAYSDNASASAILEDNSTGIYIQLIIPSSKGVLNNTTPETVYLVDTSDQLIDQISYPKAERDKSIQRYPDGGDWQKDQDDKFVWLETTPKESNLQFITPSPEPTEAPTAKPTDNINNIYLSELYPSPNSGEQEWVEIYNNNEEEKSIKDWYIADDAHKQSVGDLKIGAHKYAVIKMNSGFLNNSGENIYLKSADDQQKDKLPQAYPEIDKGLSWAKVGDDWCIGQPSENNDNHCYIAPTPTPTPSPTPTPTISPKSIPTNLPISISINKPATFSADRKLPTLTYVDDEASVAGVATSSGVTRFPKFKIIFITLVLFTGTILMIYSFWGDKILNILKSLR